MPIFRPTELMEFLGSLQRAHTPQESGLDSTIRPFKRTLSQNFLIDSNVVTKIMNAAGSLDTQLVIEIGPGPGVLTEQLLSNGAHVIAIEKDALFAHSLHRLDPSQTHLRVIEADVLHCHLDDILRENLAKEATVVSNLPYHLTTPILEWLMTYSEKVPSAVIMVQKEVANKLCGCAKVSYLQLFVSFFYDISRVCNVSKNSFFPKPNIDSSVIKLTRTVMPITDKEKREAFFSFVRTAFLKRRKTLVHALEGVVNRETLADALQSLSLSKASRVDDLDLKTWCKLFFTTFPAEVE